VLIEAVVLLGWWMSQAVSDEGLWATFTPFSSFNVGTVLFQWTIALVAFFLLNPVLARRFAGATVDSPADVPADVPVDETGVGL
jgi:multisubunit Na+/H+ antiporter MnhG subunit